MDNSLIPFSPPSQEGGALTLSGGGDLAPAGAYYNAPPPDAEAGERNEMAAKVRRWWAAIKRFWWLIIPLGILGTGAGFAASRYLISETYQARGSVWINDGGQAGTSALGQRELLSAASWIVLFRSNSVIDPVIDSLGLWYAPKVAADRPALAGLRMAVPGGKSVVPGEYTLAVGADGGYTLSETKMGVVERGRLGDSVGRIVGVHWVPTTQTLGGRTSLTFRLVQPSAVAFNLAEQVVVAMEDRSTVLQLGITGFEKERTARLLDEWMRQFVERAIDLRRRNTSDVAVILSRQRAAAQRQLQDAESALQSFRAGAITQPSEGASGGSTADALAAEYFLTRQQIQATRRDRLELENVVAAGRAGNLSVDAVLAIGAVRETPQLEQAVRELAGKEAELRTARQSFTDEHKTVKDLLATVNTLRTQTIPNYAESAARILRQREVMLSEKEGRESTQLREVPKRTLDEARLRRDVTAAEEFFQTIDKRYEEARLGSVSTVPDVSILDPAQASVVPQRNMQLIFIIGGLFGSLLFGAAIALLLDMIDHRFRYPEQINDELKIDVIGAIPVVPKPSQVSKDPEGMLQSVEAFRGLRMHVHHSFSAPPVMLTITSPGAGDGKSMIASNLALSFAEAGYRTLLIDGDIRRGKLHAVFGIQRRPGLLDYLAGEAELNDVMRDVATSERLTIIPSGTRRHRGPELLTSARLPMLLNTVRTRYDVILIDSAPLGAGIDAYALAVATKNVALVMRTGVTDRRMAKAKLKLLEKFPVRLLGAIVNDVPAAGLYQEYSYLYGYSPDIDGDSGQEKVPMLRQTNVSHK